MDNVTHTLVGVGLGNAFTRRRIGKETVPILAIASNLPDLDALVVLSGDPRSVLLRRTFGHSLLLLPVWILLLAIVFRRFYPRIPLRTTLLLCSLGAGLHLLFDLVNSFGVVLLWPLSPWRPELATVFIIDFALTGMLALPLLLCIPRSRRGSLEGLSRASVVAVTLYLLLCGAGRWMATRALAQEALRLPAPADFTYVFPEPLGPQRWRGVIREGDRYQVSLIHPFSGKVEPAGEVKTSAEDPRVMAVRRSAAGRRVEEFFKAPVWQVSEAGDATRVSAWDLRFRPIVLKRDAIFVFSFQVSPAGEVEEVLHPSDFLRGR